ncbi:hypothetical protein FQN57_007226 [Myotisia sp. PD_48]|nr:hypothetical protein FQN57_007226 [Myotisia sp. PD_48]
MPFVIYANVNFVPGKYDEWIAGYKELERYVISNEPTTHTYYFGTPENYGTEKRSKTTHMLAYEAYGNREDLYTTHLSSPAMNKFLPVALTTMTTGLDLVNYEDVAGFMDKPGDMTECGIIWDTRLTINEASFEQVLSNLTRLAEWVEKSEPDTYTFLIHKGLDEENKNELRVLERYRTRDALEKHQASAEVLLFFRENKDAIVRLENRGYLPNGLGWLHR